MIRTKRHNGADYILIDTEIMVYEEGQVVSTIPMQIQVRLGTISDKRRLKVYKYASLCFDRTFAVDKLQPEIKKGWFSRLFNK